MPRLTLAIANRAYSSWSFRAWLGLRLSGVPFEVVRLPMGTPEWDRRISEFSPTGKLPALLDGDLRVWDSLAILEHLAERYPAAPRWPDSPALRAEARSVSAEMHSGFMGLRAAMPFNCRAKASGWKLPDSAREDVARVKEIWASCLSRAPGGPFLFVGLCLADVLYAPVALRFDTYGVELGPPCDAYIRTIREMPEVREWVEEARSEPEVMDEYEACLRN